MRVYICEKSADNIDNNYRQLDTVMLYNMVRYH